MSALALVILEEPLAGRIAPENIRPASPEFFAYTCAMRWASLAAGEVSQVGLGGVFHP